MEGCNFGAAGFFDRAQPGENLLSGHLMSSVVSEACPIEAGLRQALLEHRRAAEGRLDLADPRRHLRIADFYALALGLLPEQFLVDQFIQGLRAQALVKVGVADARHRPPLGLEVS